MVSERMGIHIFWRAFWLFFRIHREKTSEYLHSICPFVRLTTFVIFQEVIYMQLLETLSISYSTEHVNHGIRCDLEHEFKTIMYILPPWVLWVWNDNSSRERLSIQPAVIANTFWHNMNQSIDSSRLKVSYCKRERVFFLILLWSVLRGPGLWWYCHQQEEEHLWQVDRSQIHPDRARQALGTVQSHSHGGIGVCACACACACASNARKLLAEMLYLKFAHSAVAENKL